MPIGRRHYRIKLADAVSAHARALVDGGLDGAPNLDLVRSAIGRPYLGYNKRITQKAAALVESLANNHGFADGNKRTTLILMDLLLTKSGYELKFIPSEGDGQITVEEMILGSVENEMSLDKLVDWFEDRIQKSHN